jgi:small-conductance mechanosensitive channel
MDWLDMEQIQNNLPLWIKNRYIAAAVIIVVSFAAAALVDFIVVRVCRVLARRSATTLDDRLIDLVHGPVKTTVILFGLWLATARLLLPPQPQAIAAAVLKTVALLVWTVFAIRLIASLLKTLSRADHVTVVQPRTRPLFDNLARILIFAAAIYFVFVFWGINVSAWLASAGIVGIAVGFAAKDTLANLFSGISILADAPYKVGDYINLDTGERGEVRHIGLRSTRLLTRDDVEITIPNAVIANAKIVNESGGPWAKERIRIKFSVAYGSDVDHVRKITAEVGRENPLTSDDPEPRARFRAFGDSSLDFELLCWIDEPVLRGRVVDALLGEIYKRLGAEGIEIPFPKRDVYIRQMPGGLGDNKT